MITCLTVRYSLQRAEISALTNAANQDLLARQSALSVEHSFIVQAPAGSGKTELLTQRLLALLATVQRPEEVLALTFTNKAAAEMRERVAAAFELVLQDADGLPDHRRATRSLAVAVMQRSDELGWALASALHRLRITTVDAFNRYLVSAAPVTSGLDVNAAPLTGVRLNELYDVAASRVIDWLESNAQQGGAVRVLLGHLDNDVQRWRNDVATLLRLRDQWLPFLGVIRGNDSDALRLQLEAALADLVRAPISRVAHGFSAAERNELVGLMQRAGERLRAANKADALAKLAADQIVLDESLESQPSWFALASLLTLKDKAGFRRQINKSNGFPAKACDGDDLRIKELLAEFRERESLLPVLLQIKRLPPPVISDSQWEVFAALLTVLPLAVAELKNLFNERGQLDFSEIAQGATRLLGDADSPGDLVLALDYSIRHVLVDEMQDTSITQYRLLERLTAGWQLGDGRTLFCVGDPMQSIYSFREADVGRFLAAVKNGIGSVMLEPLVLTRNFRSDPLLVDWCNSCFDTVFPSYDDSLESVVSFTSSVAAASETPAGAIVWHAWPERDDAAEAQAVVNAIRKDRASGCQSIAILVRGRNHLQAILPELHRAGVPFRAVEIDRLIDLPEIHTLYALAMVLMHPADRLSWLGVLRGPWLRLSLAELEQCFGTQRVEMPAGLADPQLLARLPAEKIPAIERLREHLAVAQSSRRYSLVNRVERLWQALNGPAYLDTSEQVDNAYRFFDILHNLCADGIPVEPTDLTRALREERVSQTVSDPDVVEVMTIHKSKGLEFDSVIVPGLGRAPRSHTAPLMQWQTLRNDRGTEVPIISLAAGRDQQEPDRLHLFMADTAKRRIAQELNRLLYVTCTRARQRLHLMAAASEVSSGERKPANGSLLACLWPAVNHQFDAALDEAASGEGPLTADVVDLPRHRLGEILVTSDKIDVPAVGRATRTELSDNEVEFSWVGSFGRTLGTAVHRWLQRLGEFDVLSEAKAFHEQSHEVHVRLLRVSGMREQDLRVGALRFQKAIEAFFEDPKASWILFGNHKSMQRELGLSAVTDGVLQNVIIDCVIVDDQDEHWLIDYKTSSHEGGGRSQFLESEVERYTPQMRRYRRIYKDFTGAEPRLGLYFPMLREFRELR